MNKTLKVIVLFVITVSLFGIFTLIIPQSFMGVQAQEGWLDGWQYRKSHIVNAATGAGTNYQVRIKVHFDGGIDNGEDVYLNDYSNYLYHRVSVPPQIHEDYGLSYPVTYVFKIPPNSFNLKAYKRCSSDEDWVQLTEMVSSEFFNGIECVRFDYVNNKAYVSVAFSSFSDEIDIRITDNEGNTIPASFLEVSKYYDNRKAAVVVTADDWCGEQNRQSAMINAVNAFQSRRIWLTVGVITVNAAWVGGGAPNWTAIQEQLDEGYVEVASHSRTHPNVPYGDYDSEIGGSKNDIIGNLTLPTIYRKGEHEYVWAWIEPYGASDTKVRQKLGQFKYLIARTAQTGQNGFASWDDANDLFQRYGLSIQADFETASKLNGEFDARYASGEIYHFYFHPINFDWSGTNAITQHLDYIKGKLDVWYVGLGALYQYHYVTRLASLGQLQIKPVYKLEKCRSDFGDIRFTRSDGVSLLNYWMEEKVDDRYAIFWVKIADDLSTSPATIYIYYGNPTATTTSNGDNTFLFFDDFYGSTYDSNKWQVVGLPTIAIGNGELKIQRDSYSGSWSVHGLRSKTFQADEKRLIVKMKTPSAPSGCNVRADMDYYSVSRYDKVVFEDSSRNIYLTSVDMGGAESNLKLASNALADTYYTFYLTRWGSSHLKAWINGDYAGQITSHINDGSTYIGLFIEEWRSHSTIIGVYDWIAVAKYVYPEPSHGTWGSEETQTNNTPIIGEFQAPAIVYANKYFLLNATIIDPDGLTELERATVELEGIILKWEAISNMFSKLSDPNNYCILDPAGSFKTQLNATAYKLSWKIKLNWAYPEGSVSILPTNTKVFDIHGASSSGNHVDLFTFEDDLIVYSASTDDYRINPAQTITITGTLYYEGTTIPPEDLTGITAKVNLGNTLVGSTAVIGTDGTFTISFAGEQDVGQYPYTVYATTNENTVQNKTVKVIVDKIKVQSYNVNDTRVNVNDNVNIDVLLNYEYDNAPVVDGSVTINGYPAVHQGGVFWRITQVKSTVQAVTYNTVAVSGNIYGITAVDQNGKSITVIWDRIKVASLTASDSRTDVGSNVTLTVQLVYEYDNALVSSGHFTLNGLLLTYQNGVWITIDIKNSATTFTYNKVEGADEDYGITVINMHEQSTTVIWDRVLIILLISDERIDVGATADVTFTGIYEFDSMPFTGTITLNDTTTKNTVGKYGYKVSSIFDPVYGLTAFTTNEVYCIFDRINITKFEALDNRINVGDTASFRVEGVYEYDSTRWIGSYELNDTATKTIVGKYWYKIVKVTDSNYGLTVFQQTTPDAYVVFDRINVVSYGSDDARRDVNTDATFYLTLEYEYDGTPITDGIAYFNGSLPLEWSYANSRWEYKATKNSVQKLTLYLAEVTGNSYGITALNPSISSKTITVIWDQIKITDGGVTKETLTLDETVTVWFRAIYEYDGTPFTGNNGTLYLNGTRMTWSSTNARWEYTYTTNIVGTVTFKISAVLDSSQNLTTINDAAGAKTITIWSMPFSIISNSIITELYFNSSSKIITFKISGQDGTTGYINITIAKTLIEDVSELKIYLDDEPINYTLSYTNNFWLIHFTYHHSTHKVVIHLGSTSATKPIETYANPLTAYDIGIVTLAIFTAMKLGEKKQNRKSAKTI